MLLCTITLPGTRCKKRMLVCICDQCNQYFCRKFSKTNASISSTRLTFCKKKCVIEALKKGNVANKSFEETCFKRFGTLNPNKNAAVFEKRKQTCIKLYGTAHSLQSRAVIAKRKDTNIIKYGHTCSLICEQTAKKTKATKLKLYGDENYTNRKQTLSRCLQRYNVHNPSQFKKFKEKRTATVLKRFNVENAFQSKELMQHVDRNISSRKR